MARLRRSSLHSSNFYLNMRKTRSFEHIRADKVGLSDQDHLQGRKRVIIINNERIVLLPFIHHLESRRHYYGHSLLCCFLLAQRGVMTVCGCLLLSCNFLLFIGDGHQHGGRCLIEYHALFMTD